MQKKKYITPEQVTSEDIKRIRKKLGLTQKDFAELINCSKPTIERWETSKEPISGPIVLLLNMLDNQPDYVERIRIPEKEYDLRLYYMYKDTICTIIDVDERRQLVRIFNYADKLMFRAFGCVDNPSYTEYKEFLEARCFPRTRDKMKLILKDLDLPFYDPFMIIEKTEGRMAEDDFWIRIER